MGITWADFKVFQITSLHIEFHFLDQRFHAAHHRLILLPLLFLETSS